MIAQAREKFAQIAGPQGGTSLNGSALKAEATAEIERLETELATQVAGGRGYTFIIG
jgi:GTPase involved in cell partitioning and DNA repair